MKSRFLQLWCKLNTRKTVENCLFCFLSDYYGDYLDVVFPQFSNHFLLFPMVFPHVFPIVSTFSTGVSTVSSWFFPRFLFQIVLVHYCGIYQQLHKQEFLPFYQHCQQKHNDFAQTYKHYDLYQYMTSINSCLFSNHQPC